MVMRKCTVCGCKVPQYTQCECERQKRLDNYKDYQHRRTLDEEEKERVAFYQSKEWELCRDTVARHQYKPRPIRVEQGEHSTSRPIPSCNRGKRQ